MSKRHLLVLTDYQLNRVLWAIRVDAEDYLASGEAKHPSDKARGALERQMKSGLNHGELVWAMEEVVRQDKRRSTLTYTKGEDNHE